MVFKRPRVTSGVSPAKVPLEAHLDRLASLLSEAPGLHERTRPALEELLETARMVAEPEAQMLLDAGRQLYRHRTELACLYGTYVRERELTEAAALLVEDGADPISRLGGFGRDAFERVRDMFAAVDFSTCERLVMVGCGPLPVTILHLLARTDVPTVVGMDCDEAALASARRLLAGRHDQRVRWVPSDGGRYDYGEADLIYVANLVRPKKATLDRVAATARRDAVLVLRDPFALGHLFADHGAATLHPAYEVTGVGDGNTRFLSRHVFLRLRVGS